MTIDQFRALLSNTDLFVYERSVDEAENTVAALVKQASTCASLRRRRMCKPISFAAFSLW